MYRLGVKSCLAVGGKLIFTLYLIFLNHVTPPPIEHIFQLKVCIADF